MELCVGTSGFSYEQWKGPFYPEDLPASQMLRYYAERLSSVEINNTFYRMPRSSVLEGWLAQVPESFRFAIKASRRITHVKRLKEAGEETDYLLGRLAALGDRLGVVLFQLPPNLKCDLPRLESFLARLAGRVPAAFEFRHPTWQEDEVAALLREHGAALCCADDDEQPASLVVTAPFAYLRLRRSCYEPDELASWARRLCDTRCQRAFVFFKHEEAGAGPRLAAAFRERVEATRAPAA
jgi:uncharacterized protein YecE (DUF72 family)